MMEIQPLARAVEVSVFHNLDVEHLINVVMLANKWDILLGICPHSGDFAYLLQGLTLHPPRFCSREYNLERRQSYSNLSDDALEETITLLL